MKRIILLIFTILPLYAVAQAPTFDELMEEYSSRDGCTTINISRAMFKSMGVEIGADYLQAISVENVELIPHFEEQAKMLVAEYSVIMSVGSGGERVNIYQQTTPDGKISVIIIFTTDGEEAVLMYIKGDDIEFSDISSLVNI